MLFELADANQVGAKRFRVYPDLLLSCRLPWLLYVKCSPHAEALSGPSTRVCVALPPLTTPPH